MITTFKRTGKRVLPAGVAALGIALGTFRGDLAAADPPAPSVDWSRAELVTVQMVEDRFIPNQFRFRHGVPYRLHLENNGSEMHEFTAPEFFKAIVVKNPEVLEREQNEVLLHPNERKDLYFVAPKPGHYALICADHDWDGMKGDITVE